MAPVLPFASSALAGLTLRESSQHSSAPRSATGRREQGSISSVHCAPKTGWADTSCRGTLTVSVLLRLSSGAATHYSLTFHCLHRLSRSSCYVDRSLSTASAFR